MDTVTAIPLDPALEFGGKTYDELRIREPTWGELQEARRSDVADDAVLIGKLSGVPRQALSLLPASVMLEAGEIVQGFLVRRRLSTNGAT